MLKRVFLSVFLIGVIFSVNAMDNSREFGECLQRYLFNGLQEGEGEIELLGQLRGHLVPVVNSGECVWKYGELVSKDTDCSCSVDYNKAQNSIVARLRFSLLLGKDLHPSWSTRFITVVKFLDNSCFDITAEMFWGKIHDVFKGATNPLVNPFTITKLKEKIAKFEKKDLPLFLLKEKTVKNQYDGMSEIRKQGKFVDLVIRT